MRHIIPISGKDSLTTAIVQRERQPSLPYEYFYNVTGAELPEIEAWLALASDYLQAPITRIGSDLKAIIYEQGILPSRRVRYCTRLAKIIPMEQYLGSDEATVYFGIRADEQRIGYTSATGSKIIPVYPLQEMGITLKLVYRILGDRDLMPPDFFWQALYDATLPQLGMFAAEIESYVQDDNPVTRYTARSIFAGRKRPNCFYCFNQGVSEMLWLLCTHPALFAEMQAMEEEVGAEGYSWRDDWPLARVRQETEAIMERRVKKAIRQCKALLAQMDVLDEPDSLSYSTCGLVCGK